ncbi:MAG: DUF1127 domain-containing protein [Yoonia sp.]|uniref:DUF1127 domain-containing protein n=1 Tax=Yoonia sp. TaxID=2212373 RepID=UPI003EF6AE0D
MTVRTEAFLSGTSLTPRFDALLARLADARAKRKVYLRTLRELESLTRRELADIGITPSMVQDIAYEAAYGS